MQTISISSMRSPSSLQTLLINPERKEAAQVLAFLNQGSRAGQQNVSCS
jgi:hypothetical protein